MNGHGTLVLWNDRLNNKYRVIERIDQVTGALKEQEVAMKLDDRVKELIAVGASITANCQPCLQYHASEAQKSGANEQEILEAIEMGKMVRKGAASKMDKFAASLSHTAAPSHKVSSSEGGGCAA